MDSIQERPTTKREKIDWYKNLVIGLGGVWWNDLNIIGLRGYDVDLGQNENTFDKWNDTISFIWKDKEWEIYESPATLDPGVKYIEKTYKKGPKTGAKYDDPTAPVLEGQFDFTVGNFRGKTGAGKPDQQIPGLQDIDGKRKIIWQIGIFIHWGVDYGYVGDYSEGCLVIPMVRKNEMPNYYKEKTLPYTKEILSSIDKEIKDLYPFKDLLVKEFVKHQPQNNLPEDVRKKFKKKLNDKFKLFFSKIAHERFEDKITPLFKKTKDKKGKFTVTVIDLSKGVVEIVKK
jgi:hypothetical protein